MLSYTTLIALGLLSAYILSTYRAFARNLAAAKQSGIPYITSPIYAFNRVWLITHQLWLPFIGLLPHSWTHPWIEFVEADFAWKKLYKGFKEVGSDIFLVVSPGKLSLLVADPEAINQITTRRNDFPKPIEIYGSLDLFGKNVVTTEGQLWRHHRRITSPPFTERNNMLVWQESLHQAQSMMSGWMKGQASSGPLKDVAAEAMRLSLHVISRAGFGVRLEWPHEESKSQIPAGHTLSYKQAIESLLANIIVILLTPKWILNNSPFKLHKVTNEAWVEWSKYMKEMYSEKISQVKSGADTEQGLDLMGQLIKGAGITSESLNENTGTNSDKASQGASKQLLTQDEILGNAFVFILAGHETAANTIHFSILYLAMHMASQRHLQKDLDAILNEKPVSEWDYDVDMPKLFGSMCGAVMNEELRLIPPVIGIPKSTPKGRPQGLQVGGQHYTVPGGTFIDITTAAVHRNPKYWPGGEEDLLEFRPERWLLDDPSKSNTNTDEDTYAVEENLDFDGPDKRPDTAASLYRPKKGQYIPFSEGYRSCLGRRFAQVEILAVLAVIFKTYSVELDVGAYMSDEEVATASEEQKREAWNKADANARSLLRTGMQTIITIQMRKDKVPLRFVKRGHERFHFE